jgi:hypothetical protein
MLVSRLERGGNVLLTLAAMLMWAVLAMTVSVVHEHMHQWASQQQHKWQSTCQMGAVLGPQEVARHTTQNDQARTIA